MTKSPLHTMYTTRRGGTPESCTFIPMHGLTLVGHARNTYRYSILRVYEPVLHVYEPVYPDMLL